MDRCTASGALDSEFTVHWEQGFMLHDSEEKASLADNENGVRTLESTPDGRKNGGLIIRGIYSVSEKQPKSLRTS